MAASHKLAGSRIEIQSQLSVQQLFDLSEQVASENRGVSVVGVQAHVEIQSRAQSQMIFALSLKKPYLVFELNAAQNGSEVRLTSRITQYKIKQEVFLGFVPSGPKKLTGYPFYKRFLLNLTTAVEAADPSAQIAIVERPDVVV